MKHGFCFQRNNYKVFFFFLWYNVLVFSLDFVFRFSFQIFFSRLEKQNFVGHSMGECFSASSFQFYTVLCEKIIKYKQKFVISFYEWAKILYYCKVSKLKWRVGHIKDIKIWFRFLPVLDKWSNWKWPFWGVCIQLPGSLNE